jgi:zinc protease
MRYAFIMTQAVAVVAAIAGAAQCGAQRATLDRIMHTDTLPNGMQVIVIENHTVPIVTAEIVFRAGAMTQSENDRGIPHLFEHMLFKSYRGPMGEPFDADAARLEASYNGATSDEDVLYYLVVPSSNTNDALGLLARLVRDTTFNEADLRSERLVVLNEAQRDASDPKFHLDRETSKRLWGAGFPRKDIVGDERTLMAVTVPELHTVFGRYYVPNNSVLIVSGDVSAAQVGAMARRQFMEWSRQPDPFVSHPVADLPALDSSYATVVTANVTTVALEIAWQGPSVPTDRRGANAAAVLSDIVNDEESPFQARLVDSGLFQEADLTYMPRAHAGQLTFHGITTTEKLASALTALVTEFGFMESDDYVLPTDIASATKRRAVERVFEVEDAHALALDLADTWAVAGTDYFRNYSEDMATTTESDLHSFVERYLATKRFAITALIPPEKTAETVTLLHEYLRMVGQ